MGRKLSNCVVNRIVKMALHSHSLSVGRFVDQMSLALKNYQSEVDRLRQELSILCDQAGKKTKEEVDKVQGYNDVKIKKLKDSLKLVESVCTIYFLVAD